MNKEIQKILDKRYGMRGKLNIVVKRMYELMSNMHPENDDALMNHLESLERECPMPRPYKIPNDAKLNYGKS